VVSNKQKPFALLGEDETPTLTSQRLLTPKLKINQKESGGNFKHLNWQGLL